MARLEWASPAFNPNGTNVNEKVDRCRHWVALDVYRIFIASLWSMGYSSETVHTFGRNRHIRMDLLCS